MNSAIKYILVLVLLFSSITLVYAAVPEVIFQGLVKANSDQNVRVGYFNSQTVDVNFWINADSYDDFPIDVNIVIKLVPVAFGDDQNIYIHDHNSGAGYGDLNIGSDLTCAPDLNIVSDDEWTRCSYSWNIATSLAGTSPNGAEGVEYELTDGNYIVDINIIIIQGGGPADANFAITDLMRSGEINIDTNSPSITITSPAGTTKEVPYDGPSIILSYAGVDDVNSGVQQYWVKKDSGLWQYKAAFTSHSFGTEIEGSTHTYYARVVDFADNNADTSVTIVFAGGGGSTGDVCGDGICEGDETSVTCAADCSAVCGDGACTREESSITCAEDCIPVCSDEVCDASAGETCGTCEDDCGVCEEDLCADVTCEDDGNACTTNTCDSATGECASSTSADGTICGVDMVCKTGTCVAVEDTGVCALDIDCDDRNVCTMDRCVGEDCSYVPVEDGVSCASDKVCYQGVCTPTSQVPIGLGGFDPTMIAAVVIIVVIVAAYFLFIKPK